MSSEGFHNLHVPSLKIQAMLLCALLPAWAAPQEQRSSDQQPYTLHQRVEEVLLYCTVTDHSGQRVTTLLPSDFHVLEDKKPVRVLRVKQEDVPISLALVLDSSASMKDKRAAVNTAALDLITASNPNDETSLTNFADTAYLDQDFTQNQGTLCSALSANQSVSGGTALFDTIIRAANHLSDKATHSKQVIVVVTDGNDNASTADLQAAITRVQRSDGPVVYMGDGAQIRVLVADDHPMMRRGLIEEINGQPDLLVVAEAANGREAVALFDQQRPDIALIDIRMQEVDGIEAIRQIRAKYPVAKTIILTTALGDVQVVRAFKAGAFGYLLKHMLRAELLDTIRKVSRGQKQVPREVAEALAEHALDDSLSDREVAVLRQASKGHSNKIIASELRLSEHTVKTHFKNILGKLRANDRTHAVAIAHKRGFFDVSESH